MLRKIRIASIIRIINIIRIIPLILRIITLLYFNSPDYKKNHMILKWSNYQFSVPLDATNRPPHSSTSPHWVGHHRLLQVGPLIIIVMTVEKKPYDTIFLFRGHITKGEWLISMWLQQWKSLNNTVFFFRCQITEAQAPFHTEQQDKNLTIISKYSLSESMIEIFHGGGGGLAGPPKMIT